MSEYEYLEDELDVLLDVKKQELGPLQESWIAALRSGKYEQGKMYLNLGGKFCCLGVACDISKEELQLDVKSVVRESGNTVKYYDGKDSRLPYDVKEYFRFKCYVRAEGVNELANLNDSKGKTFEEIADIVEENPEHYFTEAV